MSKSILGVIVFCALLAMAYYFWQKTEPTLEIPTTPSNPLDVPRNDVLTTIAPPETDSPETENLVPLEEEQYNETDVPTVDNTPLVEDVLPPAPLPLLDESDDAIADAINQLTDAAKIFLFKSFIRHFVVTIDNMTHPKIPQRYIFTQRVPDKFAVIQQDIDTALLDEKNFKRYKKFVNLAETINTDALLIEYAKFYPLFQEAYEDLGYPDKLFNNRFMQVIDHLLMAPEIKGAISLVRPKVFYQFAKPELEELSSGQKILIRIGVDNSQRIKEKLRTLRTALASLSLPSKQ